MDNAFVSVTEKESSNPGKSSKNAKAVSVLCSTLYTCNQDPQLHTNIVCACYCVQIRCSHPQNNIHAHTLTYSSFLHSLSATVLGSASRSFHSVMEKVLTNTIKAQHTDLAKRQKFVGRNRQENTMLPRRLASRYAYPYSNLSGCCV